MLSDDLLKGVRAIAEYLGPQFTSRQVYHLAEKGSIPVFRLPDSTTIYARKSELDRHFTAGSPLPTSPEPESVGDETAEREAA